METRRAATKTVWDWLARRAEGRPVKCLRKVLAHDTEAFAVLEASSQHKSLQCYFEERFKKKNQTRKEKYHMTKHIPDV